jgi:hypothetical protein
MRTSCPNPGPELCGRPAPDPGVVDELNRVIAAATVSADDLDPEWVDQFKLGLSDD